MTVLSKLTDALSMFWQSLDEEERRVVAYVVAYLAVSAVLGLQSASAQRRERRLREDVAAVLREHGARAGT